MTRTVNGKPLKVSIVTGKDGRPAMRIAGWWPLIQGWVHNDYPLKIGVIA